MIKENLGYTWAKSLLKREIVKKRASKGELLMDSWASLKRLDCSSRDSPDYVPLGLTSKRTLWL